MQYIFNVFLMFFNLWIKLSKYIIIMKIIYTKGQKNV
jgi:hypothetical protein